MNKLYQLLIKNNICWSVAVFLLRNNLKYDNRDNLQVKPGENFVKINVKNFIILWSLFLKKK